MWNQPSLGVSRSLGYRNGGIKRVVARPGELTEQQEVRLDRGEFVRPDWDVTVEGLEAARRDLFFAWR